MPRTPNWDLLVLYLMVRLTFSKMQKGWRNRPLETSPNAAWTSSNGTSRKANFLHCAGWGPMSNTTLEQSVQVALSCTETLEAGYTDPKSRKYYFLNWPVTLVIRKSELKSGKYAALFL